MDACYVIEPDRRPGALRALLGARLAPEEAPGALERAVVERIAVWPGPGRCRVTVRIDAPLSSEMRQRVEGELARLLTHVTAVEVEWASASEEPSPSPARRNGNGTPEGRAPGDVRPASEMEEDEEYARRLAEYAQQAAVNGSSSRNGTNGSAANGISSPVVRGRPIQAEPMAIRALEERGPGTEPVTIAGQVIRMEVKELRRGQRLVEFDVTDRTDSITCKVLEAEDGPVAQRLQEGLWLKVRGRLEIDRFSGELVLNPSDVSVYTPRSRTDDAPVKRVEFHLHTKMSGLDGVAEVAEIISLAADWGHPAVAITDHGVVHAFPEAYQAAKKKGIKLIYGVEGYLVDDAATFRESRSYHIVILARNPTGLRNLYRLISLSHLEYFYRTPRIPRQELERYREGLIVGSACEAGELFQAFLEGRDWEQLKEIARFYDYLEIQPLANNRFLIEDGRVPDEEALRDINRSICRLARELNLPVIATGDVHFLHPEDEVFRRILMAGHGFDEPEHPTPLYLRTTQEMLEEFAYLGEDLARAAVIDNPRALAEQCEAMPPVPEGLFPPRLPGAEEEIQRMAWEEAKRRYGDPLPEQVQARIERELTAVVGNGFASLYLIAHRLVNKSLEDGYLVGSRGSVGSSLVATLCGITEVNPLPPHYRCREAHYVEFVDDGSVGAGADLPDKPCPRCGAPLLKDGFDIPFEVFMGFHGEKVPDIDLNFSGEYQSEVHRHAEAMLGPENVYRAGTIATVAERSAFGYVRNYLDSRGIKARQAEVNRLVKGCSGVRRTTGQHPGGLMIVPQGREIYDFTPVQRPANDRNSPIITTHFDYHAIHDQLVKLDLLGHDDPTMLRLLEELTGVDVLAIPLDDPDTLSLFSGVEALGIDPQHARSKVGTLGIPEFGTRFVRQMLEETKPSNFSQLVRISGFSHGTNVWANNAQDLIRNKIADLNEAIATRDDIMIELIRRGMEPAEAFRIMENVRKGRGLSPEDEEAMRAVGTPSWYINSCQKITYMFPKAHAVAYVIMAFRIAYFKVHHPWAYYAAYFTVNADDFDAELALQGPAKIARFIDDVEQRPDASPRDKNRAVVAEVLYEGLLRGLKLQRVDLYASDALRFRLEPEGLRPPLRALQGVGAAAAESIAKAREEGPFTSVEALQRRCRVSRAVTDVLRRHGALGDLPETDQLQLF